MSIVVQKYGGSSVATPAKLRQVAERIIATRDSGHQVVVVVSAMADTTDDLLKLAKQVSQSPQRRELDMLLTTGERISMALLTMAIRELGGEAISFTGSQAGILTNDQHVDAQIIEVRPVRVQDELARGRIVIIAGYQGMSYKREITTLGRGGSDTTAVALAAALDAEWCEICSDVDGVYTSDPRVVPNATRIAEMSYEETREMAENGAKVLNARAVEFAAEKNIAIFARATNGPLPGADPTTDGTVVRKNAPQEAGRVTGIAIEKQVYLYSGTTEDPNSLWGVLNKHSLSPKRSNCHLTIDGQAYQVSLLLSPEDAHQLADLNTDITSACPNIQLIEDVGTVSTIGAGIHTRCDHFRTGNQSLRQLDCQIVAIDTSPIRITWVLPISTIEKASQILHRDLIEP